MNSPRLVTPAPNMKTENKDVLFVTMMYCTWLLVNICACQSRNGFVFGGADGIFGSLILAESFFDGLIIIVCKGFDLSPSALLALCNGMAGFFFLQMPKIFYK
jgi:hypothetical protein